MDTERTEKAQMNPLNLIAFLAGERLAKEIRDSLKKVIQKYNKRKFDDEFRNAFATLIENNPKQVFAIICDSAYRVSTTLAVLKAIENSCKSLKEVVEALDNQELARLLGRASNTQEMTSAVLEAIENSCKSLKEVVEALDNQELARLLGRASLSQEMTSAVLEAIENSCKSLKEVVEALDNQELADLLGRASHTQEMTSAVLEAIENSCKSLKEVVEALDNQELADLLGRASNTQEMTSAVLEAIENSSKSLKEVVEALDNQELADLLGRASQSQEMTSAVLKAIEQNQLKEAIKYLDDSQGYLIKGLKMLTKLEESDTETLKKLIACLNDETKDQTLRNLPASTFKILNDGGCLPEYLTEETIDVEGKTFDEVLECWKQKCINFIQKNLKNNSVLIQNKASAADNNPNYRFLLEIAELALKFNHGKSLSQTNKKKIVNALDELFVFSDKNLDTQKGKDFITKKFDSIYWYLIKKSKPKNQLKSRGNSNHRLSENDRKIYLGRGSKVNNNDANKVFIDLIVSIARNIDGYKQFNNKKKNQLAKNIYDLLYEQGYRFIDLKNEIAPRLLEKQVLQKIKTTLKDANNNNLENRAVNKKDAELAFLLGKLYEKHPGYNQKDAGSSEEAAAPMNLGGLGVIRGRGRTNGIVEQRHNNKEELKERGVFS